MVTIGLSSRSCRGREQHRDHGDNARRDSGSQTPEESDDDENRHRASLPLHSPSGSSRRIRTRPPGYPRGDQAEEAPPFETVTRLLSAFNRTTNRSICATTATGPAPPGVVRRVTATPGSSNAAASGPS